MRCQKSSQSKIEEKKTIPVRGNNCKRSFVKKESPDCDDGHQQKKPVHLNTRVSILNVQASLHGPETATQTLFGPADLDFLAFLCTDKLSPEEIRTMIKHLGLVIAKASCTSTLLQVLRRMLFSRAGKNSFYASQALVDILNDKIAQRLIEKRPHDDEETKVIDILCDFLTKQGTPIDVQKFILDFLVTCNDHYGVDLTKKFINIIASSHPYSYASQVLSAEVMRSIEAMP